MLAGQELFSTGGEEDIPHRQQRPLLQKHFENFKFQFGSMTMMENARCRSDCSGSGS